MQRCSLKSNKPSRRESLPTLPGKRLCASIMGHIHIHVTVSYCGILRTQVSRKCVLVVWDFGLINEMWISFFYLESRRDRGSKEQHWCGYEIQSILEISEKMTIIKYAIWVSGYAIEYSNEEITVKGNKTGDQCFPHTDFTWVGHPSILHPPKYESMNGAFIFGNMFAFHYFYPLILFFIRPTWCNHPQSI